MACQALEKRHHWSPGRELPARSHSEPHGQDWRCRRRHKEVEGAASPGCRSSNCTASDYNIGRERRWQSAVVVGGPLAAGGPRPAGRPAEAQEACAEVRRPCCRRWRATSRPARQQRGFRRRRLRQRAPSRCFLRPQGRQGEKERHRQQASAEVMVPQVAAGGQQETQKGPRMAREVVCAPSQGQAGIRDVVVAAA